MIALVNKERLVDSIHYDPIGVKERLYKGKRGIHNDIIWVVTHWFSGREQQMIVRFERPEATVPIPTIHMSVGIFPIDAKVTDVEYYLDHNYQR